MTAVALEVTASCAGCPWTVAGPSSDWDAIQRAADRHLAPGHPVGVTAVPVDGERRGAARVTGAATASSAAKAAGRSHAQ